MINLKNKIKDIIFKFKNKKNDQILKKNILKNNIKLRNKAEREL